MLFRLFAAALLFVGCGASQKQQDSTRTCPEWTQGAQTTSKYPPSLYIVGIGVANIDNSREQTERAAMTQAFGNIAAQVKVQVQAEVNIHDWERRDSSTDSFQGSEVNQSATLQSEILLEGVDVVARCNEESDGNFYVMAVLDRQRFGERAQMKISALNSETYHTMNSLEQGGELDPMKKLQLLQRALETTMRSMAYTDLARDIAGLDSPPPQFPITQIKTEMGQIRSTQLTVEVKGDSPSPILQAVQKAVSKAGLPLAKETEATVPTALVMEVNTTFKDRYEDSLKMTVSVATVSIAIRNKFRNQIEKSLVISEKRGGDSPEAAKTRVTNGITQAVEKDTVKAIEELLSFSD